MATRTIQSVRKDVSFSSSSGGHSHTTDGNESRPNPIQGYE